MATDSKVLQRLTTRTRAELAADLLEYGSRLEGKSLLDVGEMAGRRRGERLHAWYLRHGLTPPAEGTEPPVRPPEKHPGHAQPGQRPDPGDLTISRWDQPDRSPTASDFQRVGKPEDGEEPIEDLISRRESAYEEASRRWAATRGPRQLRMPPGPYAVAHFGDPHLDDDGCDWPALLKAVRVVSASPGFYGGNIGDLVNNWAPGRLADLYGEQSSTIDEGWRLSRWLIRALPWLYVCLGNHDCASADTECLTRRGWLRYDEILPTDEVLSFVPETGRGAWSPIEDIIIRDHDGPMVEIDIQSVSARVTPNHRWLVGKGKPAKGWEFRTSDDLPKFVTLPVAVSLEPPESTLFTDDEIALAGWILTDGGISSRGYVSLYQSKQPGVSRIDDLLVKTGFMPTRSVRIRNIEVVAGRKLLKPPLPAVEWHFSADDSARLSMLVPRRGEIPVWAWDLSDRQFGVLLDAIVDGDGHRATSNAWVVYKDRAFLDSLQAHCVTRGWRSRISNGKGRTNDWRLNICRKGTVGFWRDLNGAVSQTGPVQEKVWCLTVPHGNFMVRRHGGAYFTGNCWRSGRTIIGLLCEGAKIGLMAPDEVRLELLSPGTANTHRLWCRHDFKGQSIWNQAHGPMRAGKLDHWADVHVAGHLHEWVTHCEEGPDGKVRWAIRTRGFKRLDAYAVAGQFPEHRWGEVVSTVVDPTHEHPYERVRVHLDVEEAAEHLAWLRKRRMGGAA